MGNFKYPSPGRNPIIYIVRRFLLYFKLLPISARVYLLVAHDFPVQINRQQWCHHVLIIWIFEILLTKNNKTLLTWSYHPWLEPWGIDSL